MLAEINNFTSEEYRQYQKSLENMGELENIISSTAELAEQRGRAEGLAEVAKEMLADGVPLDKIAKYTGLSQEEIAALK